MKTKIYQVKSGYNTIATFDNLEQATKFFADLVRGAGKTLLMVSGKGSSAKKAHFWGASAEFSIKIDEAHVYPSKKDAEFAVFEAGEGDDEDKT